MNAFRGAELAEAHERLMRTVRVLPTDCWESQLARTKSGRGYVRVRLNGVQVMGHRIAYEFANGPVPDGLLVCHRCDHPPCVNPAHLFLGTNSDNQLDSSRKRRHVGNRKLTRAKVLFIRDARSDGASRDWLAALLGVSRSTIALAELHYTWN